MPRIRTYEEQVGLTAPESRSNVSVENAGLRGKSLANLGGAIQGLGETLYKADTKDDVSNTTLGLSKINNKYNDRILELTQSGELNGKEAIEKLSQDYQNDVNQIAGNLKTADGQRFFEEHSASLGYDILRTAKHASAQVAGKLAVERITTTMDLDGNTLMKNPAAYDGTLLRAIGGIEAEIKGGSLPRVDGEELKRKIAEQYAQSAILGYANSDPDMALAAMSQKKFDFLKPDDRQGLITQIRAYKSAKKADIVNAAALQEIARKKAAESWGQDALMALENHQLTGKEILHAPALHWEEKKQWLNLLDKSVSKQFSTDKAVVNALTQKILLPPEDTSGQRIVNRQQLIQYIGNGATIADVNKLTKLMDSTPEGIRMNSQRKLFFDAAKAQIIRTSLFDKTAIGHDKLAQLTDVALKAEEAAIKAGKDPASIYDINSKDSLWSQIPKYKTTTQDMLNSGFNTATPQGAEPHALEEEKIKPGEDFDVYLKRRGF